MIFEYRNGPMYYVDGTPAYKAGEWEGKMSCKFGPTRKIIRPLTEGIIFNGKKYNEINIENEPPLVPKFRNLSQGPSKEYEFKPCIKMVNKPESDSRAIREGIKVIRPIYGEGKDRPEKRHHFIYREEYIEQIKEKEKQQTAKALVNDEFRVLNKIGFSKKALENLPNNKLLGLNFSNGKLELLF
jgi:hypothetical protein